jgi:hypothetical protein
MVYIADGAAFTNPYGGRREPNCLAIGWLAAGERFPRGDPPEGFLDRLTMLCRMPINLTRGLHRCPFCPAADAAYRTGGAWVRTPAGDFVTGHGEIRATAADGRRYAAPEMIAHYVQSHTYLPADDFIATVLATDRVPINDSGTLSLGVHEGYWVLLENDARVPISGDLTRLVPILAHAPASTLAAVAELDGPEFPAIDLLAAALRSSNGHSHALAVRWLVALNPPARGPLARAAKRALKAQLTPPPIQEQLDSWLQERLSEAAEPKSRVVVQCNLLRSAGQPPRAYVANPNWGNVAEHIEILVRQRSGALSLLWVPIADAGAFRAKTIPPQHPLFHDDRILDYHDRPAAEEGARRLQAAHEQTATG